MSTAPSTLFPYTTLFRARRVFAALAHAGVAEAAVQGHRKRATGLAQHVLRGGGVQRPEIQLLLIVDMHAHLFARAGLRQRGKRDHTAGRERGAAVAAAHTVVRAELRIEVPTRTADTGRAVCERLQPL